MNVNLLKSGALAIAVSATVLLGGKSEAATVYAGEYEATSVQTGGNDHSVWLPGLFSNVSNAYWQFVGGAGKFVVGANNATATLDGRIDSNQDANLQFDLAVEYDLLTPNQPGGGGTKNGGFAGGLSAADKAALISTWSFFDIKSAVLTGVGLLDGLVLSLTPFPTAPGDIPFQLGESANDKNQGLGGAGWFSWTVDSQANNTNYVARTLNNIPGRSHGDININIAPVPLPAAGLLLLGGLGALGALRKRKNKAA